MPLEIRQIGGGRGRKRSVLACRRNTSGDTGGIPRGIRVGFTEYAGEDAELGFEKIALFANENRYPLHAARQLPSGRWASKLGEREDMEHALHDLEEQAYGTTVLVMKRPLTTGPENSD